MKISVDLHIHTDLSPCGDEMSTPGNVVGMAALNGLDAIAITDHNTLDAYRELSDPNTRNLYKGSIIPGIEITTTYNGETIEVLGNGIQNAFDQLESEVITKK